MPLYRLLYRSEFALSESLEPVSKQIDEIVDAAARNNRHSDLTGALIASNGVFIQALEGPLMALESTFEKICRDLRHRRVRLVEFAAAEERAFPEWRMVRVDEQKEVLKLCAGIDFGDAQRLDVSKTGAIISLMRSILLSKASTVNEDMRPAPATSTL